jgi:small ligand-binding sensory domain FIST
LLLADPFTSDASGLARALDEKFPGARIVGGLASGGSRPGANALWLGEDTYRMGAVAIALTGNVVVDTLVAQGTRPIGRPMTVTRGEGHRISELDKKPALDVLRDLFSSLTERDQELARHSLFLGLEMNTGNITFSGDLLTRNLVGLDPQAGTITVAADVREWQVVQFLLRDANTATEDLEKHLDRYRAGGAQPAGALLFSCLGRGVHLFGAPDHDTGLFADRLGRVPLGGFFCNGEIGPVGGSTFLHGYTSAFGLFRPRSGS